MHDTAKKIVDFTLGLKFEDLHLLKIVLNESESIPPDFPNSWIIRHLFSQILPYPK